MRGRDRVELGTHAVCGVQIDLEQAHVCETRSAECIDPGNPNRSSSGAVGVGYWISRIKGRQGELGREQGQQEEDGVSHIDDRI